MKSYMLLWLVPFIIILNIYMIIYIVAHSFILLVLLCFMTMPERVNHSPMTGVVVFWLEAVTSVPVTNPVFTHVFISLG